MHKIRKFLSLVSEMTIAVLISIYGCKKKQETIHVLSATALILDGSGEIYLVDTVTSIIEWVGSVPENYKHHGTIKLSAGQFTVNYNQITSAKFTL